MLEPDSFPLQDGEICDACGVPVFFDDDLITDCPNCGRTYTLSTDS